MPRLERARLALAPSQLDELCALLRRHLPDAEIWAYGSRVQGNAHEGSDLDLVLRNPEDLTAPVVGAHALTEALSQSRLPMLVDTHQWAHLPPAFQTEIERGYVVLQAVGEPTP
jgi:predicted nucleotidyltransferase